MNLVRSLVRSRPVNTTGFFGRLQATRDKIYRCHRSQVISDGFVFNCLLHKASKVRLCSAQLPATLSRLANRARSLASASLCLSLRLEHETLSLARRMRRRSVGDDDSAGSGDGNPSLPTDREHARFVGTYINPLAAFALFSRLGCSLLKSAFHQR